MRQEHLRLAVLLVGAAAAGALLGFLGARVVFVGSAISLLPWAVAGIALGWLCRSRAGAAGVGALFGFALAFAFMVTGYDGTAPLHTRLFPFAVLGLVGAVCGTVLAVIGRSLGRRLGPRPGGVEGRPARG